MRWKWPYITRSGDSRNRNQPTDFAEEALNLAQLSQVKQYTLGFCGLPHREIRAIRVVKDDCADARFRIHHKTFRQLNSNFFRSQQFPDPSLILKIGTRRITKAVAFPPIA